MINIFYQTSDCLISRHLITVNCFIKIKKTVEPKTNQIIIVISTNLTFIYAYIVSTMHTGIIVIPLNLNI